MGVGLLPELGRAALTDLGHSLREPLAVIADWAEANVGRITAAQESYDAGPK